MWYMTQKAGLVNLDRMDHIYKKSHQWKPEEFYIIGCIYGFDEEGDTTGVEITFTDVMTLTDAEAELCHILAVILKAKEKPRD